jgi:gamma-glutamylputrescine oxidase
MLEVYPGLRDVKIDHAWGGTLAITMTRNPCFLRVAPNVLSASGYSGHGVALATLAGRILAEAVAGQAERFDLMATPAHAALSRRRGMLRWPLLVLAMTWFSMRDGWDSDPQPHRRLPARKTQGRRRKPPVMNLLLEIFYPHR